MSAFVPIARDFNCAESDLTSLTISENQRMRLEIFASSREPFESIPKTPRLKLKRRLKFEIFVDVYKIRVQ